MSCVLGVPKRASPRAEAQITGVIQRATVGVVAAPVAAIGVGLFAISFGLVTTTIGAANLGVVIGGASAFIGHAACGGIQSRVFVE